MPIYRYKCNACGYEFDDMQPMDSIIERPCEQILDDGLVKIQCKGIAKRIPQAFSFKFNCSMPTYRKGQ